jgi:hypothetical protein
LKSIKVDEGKCEDKIGVFLLHNESLESHIRHTCNYPWSEDYALKKLYQVVVDNPIPPYFDIPMDPIKI